MPNTTSLVGVGAFFTSRNNGGLRKVLRSSTGLNPAESWLNAGSFEMFESGWSWKNWMRPSGIGMVSFGWPRRSARAATAR